VKLRDYQNECIETLDRKGSGRWLVQMSTGLGKTVVFTHMKRQGRMLILSHREELVNQPLKYFECSAGIEMADKRSDGEEVVSASVQSLIRRLGKFKGDEFDVIVVDEAHHAAAKSYRTILNHFKARQVVGFTATPNRGDKVRLNDVFDEIVFERNLRWGIENKYLSDIDCKRVDIGYDLTNVHTRQGDFAQDELAKQMEGTEKAIAEVYRKHAKGATLIFASSVKHAEAIAKKIKGAVAVTAQTPNRSEIVKKFTERKIPCIVNCMIFTEGTDLPLVETVIIARPTQSDALYAQMVGRGLRLCEGKDKLKLIDCVGVTGKRDLCTAPSLLGLDISVLDKNKRNKVEGDLLKLGEVIDRLTDTPKVWIKSIENVRLWGEEQGYNLRDVNYCRMPDGSFICNLPNGRRITIPCPDVMGNVISQATGRSIPIQEAFDKTRKFLERNYNDSKNIWDSRASRGWAREHASDKQIAFIKKNCKEYLDDINFSWLTKLEASQIISRISYEISKNS
jgi:superfamily II DNA or RNA helicase